MSKLNVSLDFPLVSVLTVVFVVLKLCGVIDWSWWLVFTPMIVDAVLVLACLLFVYLAYIRVWKG